MLCLYVQAPFAVFRTFSAGSFRPTAGFITPSAAYGLLLNLAGIDMRQPDNGKSLMTLIRSDLPRVRLALGALVFPEQHSLFQQLHNYPVGTSKDSHAVNTKGNKHNIAPARRAVLGNLKAYICLDGHEGLEAQVREGLVGKRTGAYGLPFLGDNNFLPDKLEAVSERQPAHWYEMLDHTASGEGLQERVMRLTITVDRADMARTRSQLFVPLARPQIEIPEKAWVEVGY